MSSSTPRKQFDAFICAKSEDYRYAAEVSGFLTANGVSAFLSVESLPTLGDSDYRKAIDTVLEEATHMVVVTSSRDHVHAKWVEAEWGFFVNEKRSGRKSGNLITLVAGGLRPEALPPSLRYYEVLPLHNEGLVRLLAYVRPTRSSTSESGSNSRPGRSLRSAAANLVPKSKFLAVVVIAIVCVSVTGVLSQLTQGPVNGTLTVIGGVKPGTKVLVKQHGRLVERIDLVNQQGSTVALRPGEYQLELAGELAPALTLEQTEILVSRDRDMRVVVTERPVLRAPTNTFDFIPPHERQSER